MNYSVDSYHAMQERCDRLEIALSESHALVVELEAYQRDSADRLAHMVGERAKLERHLAACKAECRAWRDYQMVLVSPRYDCEEIDSWDNIQSRRAATDAAGGVA